MKEINIEMHGYKCTCLIGMYSKGGFLAIPNLCIAAQLKPNNRAYNERQIMQALKYSKSAALFFDETAQTELAEELALTFSAQLD